MKKLLLFLVIAVFSVSAHAELNKHEQYTVDLIMSGDLGSLKLAAKKMHASATSNSEVLDVAAEVLLVNYSNLYKPQIDTFAWVLKAVGVSGNNRYYDAIQEIAENTKNKKIRRYAKSALKKLGSSDGADQYELGDVGVEVPEYL